MKMTKEKCRAFRQLREILAKKYRIDWELFREDFCPELRCRGICDCERYRLQQFYLKLWIRQKLGRGELLSVPAGIFAGVAPPEQLVWGRDNWTPSMEAALSLMDAGVATIGELLDMGLPYMERTYGLPEADAEALQILLRNLGHDCHRPRRRAPYDDFRPRR